VLFWGFANQITTVDEAKTFYPFFGLGANVALIFSGRAVKYFSQIRAGLPAGVDGWGVSLRGMMSLVVGFGIVITGIYWWLNRSVVPGIEAAASAGAAKKAKGGKNKMKENMSVGDSFKFLASSPYIRDLATLVVAYGISINLVEVREEGRREENREEEERKKKKKSRSRTKKKMKKKNKKTQNRSPGSPSSRPPSPTRTTTPRSWATSRPRRAP